MSAILVIAEHREGELREATLEALSVARALSAESGGEVVVAVLAEDPGPLLAPLMGRAARALTVAHPSLAHYEVEAYLAALSPLIAALSPRLILGRHSAQGMELLPALAGRLELQLVTDCAEVSIEAGALSVTRSPYGGKLVESLTLRPAPTTVVTLRGGVEAPDAGDLETVVVEVAQGGGAPRHARRFLRLLKAATDDVDIASAPILVSVGRGIGSQDNIALAQELADALGAVVSCSRPIADAGWLPQSRQVGTSGQTVRPRLYVALGISGAFQHLAGMSGAEAIFAINKDPRAPIFGVATQGIVGDVLELLPAITRELKG